MRPVCPICGICLSLPTTRYTVQQEIIFPFCGKYLSAVIGVDTSINARVVNFRPHPLNGQKRINFFLIRVPGDGDDENNKIIKI